MDILVNLAAGFSVAAQPSALLACFVGVLLGTLIGVLPGLGPMAVISLLLPITYHLSPVDALVMLSGIFYGSQYGGSITSILLNLPGEASSSVTCLDGHPMAKQGRGGVALVMTTVASFVGACFSIILLATMAPLLVSFVKNFTDQQYFALILLGLVAASTMSVGSAAKGIVMVAVGVIFGLVGVDIDSGAARFSYGRLELLDGLNIAVVAMGLFGISEILLNIGSNVDNTAISKRVGWRELIPTRDDWKRSALPIGRGSFFGALIGVLPGAGATIASFFAYAVEKRSSKTPERFGKGAIEGVAAPEAANIAAAQASFIPTLALGIPGSATMALMLGALMIQGIVPGPMVMVNYPDLFWGLLASFWIGNVLLVILNIPLVNVWILLLRVPYRIMFPTILFFVCLGAYTLKFSVFDVYCVLGFGLLGYFLRLLSFPVAPLLLGLVLGPMLEEHFRRSLLLAKGNLWTFFQNPVSATFLAIAAALIVFSVISQIRNRNKPRREEEEV